MTQAQYRTPQLTHQTGFRVILPERVSISLGTEAIRVDEGLRLKRNNSEVNLRLDSAAGDALLSALRTPGPGMHTPGIADTWQKVLEHLAMHGMLQDAAFTGPGVSGIDALREAVDTLYAQMTRHSSARRARFVEGLKNRNTALIWLGQAYLFTKSARHHISPVLDHDMTSQERTMWTRFLEDESWHWRIYRPAMALYGLNFPDFDSVEAAPSTQRLIDILHDGAARSPIVYAVLMNYVERRPVADGPRSDRLLSALTRNCGFTDAAVKPIWWHSTENDLAGHSDLGAVVIANRRNIDRAELDEAIARSDELIGASCEWLTDVIQV